MRIKFDIKIQLNQIMRDEIELKNNKTNKNPKNEDQIVYKKTNGKTPLNFFNEKREKRGRRRRRKKVHWSPIAPPL
jgi:hypothetical protein